MARYIDAEKLIERSILTRTYKRDSCITVDDIDDCPTEDVAPVIHAKWETGRCTNCHTDKPDVTTSVVQGYIHKYQGRLNYCPNCGAKMEEE